MDAAIVGGGIGGLTASLCLHHHGIGAHVFERAPAFEEIGAGIQLGPNAMRVLAALGLQEAVLDVASQPDALLLRSAYSGQTITQIDLFKDGQPKWGAPYVHVHRADLVAVLESAARGRGIGLHLGEDIHAGQASYGADVLVFADGMNSAFAQTAFAAKAPTYSGYAAWRALVPADAFRHDIPLDKACVWSGRNSHGVTYALRGRSLINFIGIAPVKTPPKPGWKATTKAESVLRYFRGYPPSILKLIRAASALGTWGLFTQRMQEPWVNESQALLGDACHAMVPFLAQGAAMAIEDAWALAASLAASEDRSAGLMAYERVRRPRTERVAKASERVGQLYHLKGLGPRLGAFSTLRSAQRTGLADLLGVMDWLYGYDITAQCV